MHENLQRRSMPNNNNNNNNDAQSTSINDTLPSVGSIVWTAGRTRAQQAINLYANIDYLRPYFDVEPKEISQRLINALTPRWPSPDENVKHELYGPTMIVFTLVAILIYQMKLASHSIQDGTLIGTSFLTCFGYWIGSSFAISSASFVCNTHLSIMQILSINGYALASHCIVLFLATFIHTGHDHLLFYGLWCIVGGIAATRMSFIIMARTINPRYRIALGSLLFAMHMLFLLYLHFAYHELAETVSHALNREETSPLGVSMKPVLPPVSQLADAKLQPKDRLMARNN